MTERGLRRCTRMAALVASAVVVMIFVPTLSTAQSLRGSSSSLDRQNRVAGEHEFTYLRTSSQVERFVGAGYLVRIRNNIDFQLHDVSFPYARPEVALFVARLARQYRSSCGEQLVVTSLTRPRSRQPGNASTRSVHPTGMAVDLRRSNDRSCRSWLENVLTHLEGEGVIEATRERRPPHYHIAVFPEEYTDYVDMLVRESALESTRIASLGETEYRVRNGDSLWTIAKRHGTTVDQLRSVNDLAGSRIYAGQLLTVPTGR